MTDNERITKLADLAKSAADTFLYSVKYIYAISCKNFYNVSIDEVIKIVSFDITEKSAVERLGIKLVSSDYTPLNSESFDECADMMLYAMTLRLPVFRTALSHDGKRPLLKDNGIKQLADELKRRGAKNIDNTFKTDLRINLKAAKKKKFTPDGTDWLIKRLRAKFPAYFGDNNRAAYLFGCLELFYPEFMNAWQLETIHILNEE